MSLQRKHNAGSMGPGGKFFFKRISPLVFIVAGAAMLILLPKLLDDGKDGNKDEYKDLQA